MCVKIMNTSVQTINAFTNPLLATVKMIAAITVTKEKAVKVT